MLIHNVRLNYFTYFYKAQKVYKSGKITKQWTKLKLPTLAYRRIRGDMIELFKILDGVYDSECCNILSLWKNATDRESSRGHRRKLFHTRSNYEIRRNFFWLRATKIWNDLPENVVMAPNINSFKNALDKHLKEQELLYNYKAFVHLSPDKNVLTVNFYFVWVWYRGLYI